MNSKLLKQQVDDFFCKSKSSQFYAWRQFKKQLKSEIRSSKSPRSDFKKNQSPLFKTSPIQKVQDFITKTFKPKTPEINISIEYLSEIPNKEENPTLSIKNSQLSDILPLENISLLIGLINTSTLSETYLKELKKLSEAIQQVSKKSEYQDINN